MKLILRRSLMDDKHTIGDLTIYTDSDEEIRTLKTLELPWKDNQRRISCIPEGEYEVKIHSSPKFGWSLWLQKVPNRSAILIHRGNYTRDILGCILVGTEHKDIDKDGITDVANSTIAMGILKGTIKNDAGLVITIVNPNKLVPGRNIEKHV